MRSTNEQISCGMSRPIKEQHSVEEDYERMKTSLLEKANSINRYAGVGRGYVFHRVMGGRRVVNR